MEDPLYSMLAAVNANVLHTVKKTYLERQEVETSLIQSALYQYRKRKFLAAVVFK